MEEKTIKEIQKELFDKLVQLDVNDKTEKKNDLTYLSWAWAWQEFKRICPDATYEIKKFPNENGTLMPYVEDKDLGFMVFTEITAGGITYEMWLPVMDGANKSMKREAYTYQTKFSEKSVDACSMFDVNKTIMRCLVKNIAMFGLGIYIYAGEDLPLVIEEPCTKEQIEKMRELKIIEPNVCKQFKVSKIEELTIVQADYVIKAKETALKKMAKTKGEENAN